MKVCGTKRGGSNDLFAGVRDPCDWHGVAILMSPELGGTRHCRVVREGESPVLQHAGYQGGCHMRNINEVANLHAATSSAL